MSHLKINLKETWDMIFKLMEGFQTHHRKCVEKNFKYRSGKVAKKCEENAEILKAVEVDFSVIDEIPAHEIQQKLGVTPSKKEIKKAISKMANNKAPGKSGLTTDMIKSLPPQST